MAVQRRRDEHRVDVLEIEQPAVVAERARGRRHAPYLVVAARVHVGNGDELHVGELQRLRQQVLAARAATDQSQPQAVVGAEYARHRRHHPYRGAGGGGIGEELPASDGPFPFSGHDSLLDSPRPLLHVVE